MSNQVFKAYRETSLPSQLQPYAVYYVNPTAKPDYVEIYVTDSAGNAKRMFGQQDVQTMINELKASSGKLFIAEDINGRDGVSGKVTGTEVFVKDATDDPTVKSGGARYLWDGSAWIKVSETEAMDVVFNWAGLADKPTSTVQAIDQAVTNSHTHSNKTQLDKIDEDSSGNLTYGGKAVKTQWESTGW